MRSTFTLIIQEIFVQSGVNRSHSDQVPSSSLFWFLNKLRILERYKLSMNVIKQVFNFFNPDRSTGRDAQVSNQRTLSVYIHRFCLIFNVLQKG